MTVSLVSRLFYLNINCKNKVWFLRLIYIYIFIYFTNNSLFVKYPTVCCQIQLAVMALSVSFRQDGTKPGNLTVTTSLLEVTALGCCLAKIVAAHNST